MGQELAARVHRNYFSNYKGNELPLGWQEVSDPAYGKYYVNHINRHVQITDPRLEFMKEKQQMINNFVSIARNDVRRDRARLSGSSCGSATTPTHHETREIQRLKIEN